MNPFIELGKFIDYAADLVARAFSPVTNALDWAARQSPRMDSGYTKEMLAKNGYALTVHLRGGGKITLSNVHNFWFVEDGTLMLDCPGTFPGMSPELGTPLNKKDMVSTAYGRS